MNISAKALPVSLYVWKLYSAVYDIVDQLLSIFNWHTWLVRVMTYNVPIAFSITTIFTYEMCLFPDIVVSIAFWQQMPKKLFDSSLVMMTDTVDNTPTFTSWMCWRRPTGGGDKEEQVRIVWCHRCWPDKANFPIDIRSPELIIGAKLSKLQHM